jgi:hypothetical protein
MASFSPIFNEDENTVRARVHQDMDEAWAQVSVRTLDKREGSALWLAVEGVVKEISRAYSALNDVAELAFVQFLEDDFLTDKALEYGLTRISARAANGLVTFYGVAGTTIPGGTEVSNTVQFESDDVYNYETSESALITSQAGPVAAPTLSSAGLGVLSGTYSYKFSFVEVDVDGQPVAETAAGPASGVFVAANQYIQVAGFPIVPPDHRLRIYRTLASGVSAGVWKLVVELEDAVASALFTDKFLDTQLGSYNVWDGESATEFNSLRIAGPIEAPTLPAAYANVVATLEGEDHNAPAGNISFLSDGIANINTIMNHRDFITGRDLEPDEVFLPRVLAAIRAPQGAGTISDYETWMLEVPGISFVTVHPHFDGVIDRPGYVLFVVRV